MHRFTVKPLAPFQFDHLYERLQQSSNRVLYHIDDDKAISRVFMIDDRPVLVKAASLGTLEYPEIQLDVFNANDRAQADRAVSHCMHVFSLDRPLAHFYEAAKQNDPVLYALTQSHRGIHMLLEPGIYEAMILSIIGQQVNLTFAANLKHALIFACNQSLEWQGHTFYAFPTPEKVASLSYETLRGLQFSQRKAEYVIDFARLVADGKFDIEAIASTPNEEAIEAMVKLRGIGRWTAECVLLFGLGRPDVLPAADIGLRNAVKLFYNLEQQPSEEEVREKAKFWTGWESYATYYFWAALGIAKDKEKANPPAASITRAKSQP